MKTKTPKVPRNFRLDAALSAELDKRSEVTGIPRAKLLEDALSAYFGEAMKVDLSAKISQLKTFKRSFNPPSIVQMPFELPHAA